MSYESAKRITLSDKQGVFSGGYVDNVENLNLAPFYSPYLRNCRIDGQSIVIRPGHQLFVDLGSPVATGIGTYLATGGDNLIVRHNESGTEKLVLITEAGVVTNITTGANIASDNRMTFTNVADVVYCMNGSDKFGKLAGTTYTTPASVPSNFAPAFSVVFNGCNRASGRSANSNIVYKSVENNYEDFTSTGFDQLSFSEQITGLSSNSQALFFFTENTISVTGQNDIQQDGAGVLVYNNRMLQVKEGAVNHYSIIEVGTSIFYVTPSNAINRIVPGGNVYGFEVQDLSERQWKGISKLMASLDKDQSACWGYFLPKEMLIKWFFKSEGASFNDVCVVYDIIQDKFLVDGEKYFYDGVFFNGKNYTIGAIEGKVYQDEYSQDDEGQAISMEYRTKEYYISEPTTIKCLWESRTLLDINELAVLTQDIYINGQSADTKTLNGSDVIDSSGGIGVGSIGDFAIGDDGEESTEMDSDYTETYILRTKGNLNKKGYKIQRRFYNTSLAGKVRLKNIEPKIEILPAIATALTP